jgi:hypothetical protein
MAGSGKAMAGADDKSNSESRKGKNGSDASAKA